MNKRSNTRKEEGIEDTRGVEKKGEITDVLVLVLALIPPNVPGIKGGVHPFSLTLTIALFEAIQIQCWQRLSGSMPAIHPHVILRKKEKHSSFYCCIFYLFCLSFVALFPHLQHIHTVHNVNGLRNTCDGRNAFEMGSCVSIYEMKL